MLIVCIKPQPQTLFKFLRPKDLQSKNGEPSAVISGNLAWFPATKGQRGSGKEINDTNRLLGCRVQHTHTSPGKLTHVVIENEFVETNPTLAFSWNRHLFIFQIVRSAGQAPSVTATHLTPDRKTIPEANGKTPKLDFVKVGDWICREGIVGIQWIRPQVKTVLFTYFCQQCTKPTNPFAIPSC